MIVGTVLLCPPLDLLPGEPGPYDRAAVAVALTAAMPGLAVLAPPPADGLPWVAAVALALGAEVRGPLLPVLAADAGTYAPALGLSQRASRRPVAGYVLLDSPVPVADADGPEWPDAPVVYLASPAAPTGAAGLARLRAWSCIELPDRAAPTVASMLADLCRET